MKKKKLKIKNLGGSFWEVTPSNTPPPPKHPVGPPPPSPSVRPLRPLRPSLRVPPPVPQTIFLFARLRTSASQSVMAHVRPAGGPRLRV